MRPLWKGVALTVVVGVGITGCQSPQPLVAPANNPNPITALPAVDDSVVNLPISLDLETIRAQVLKNSPKPLSSGTVSQKIGFGTADITHFVNLKDVRFNVTGQQFTAVTQLDFAVDTHINSGMMMLGGVGCGVNGEEPAKVEFTLPGSLYWTQTGDLAVQAGQWQLKWLRPCQLSALKISVESLLNLPVVRDKVQALVSQQINDAMKQVGLKAMLAKNWPQLNEPRQLVDGVWLLLNPEKVGLADIQGNGRYVTTSVSVSAHPQVVTGAKPKVTLPPVPQPQRLVAPPDIFHLALRGDIGLDTANKLLNAQLANKPIDANGRQILIESIKLYGNGDKAVLGLKLQQPIQGEIYLLAKPVFDVNNNEVRLENVEYDLSTSSFLAKTANWMLHGTLKQTIEEKARFNFDRDLANTLQSFRNYQQDLGYGATLKAQITSVRPQGLFFTPTDLKAFVVVDGKLALDVAQQKK